MKGFALGALTLITLDVVLSGPASRVTGVFGAVTVWLAKWMDPSVPLIEDKSKPANAKEGGISGQARAAITGGINGALSGLGGAPWWLGG